MQTQMVPLESIKPYENNPRINDGAVDAVAESIKQFGWRSPIVVDEQMVILAGHTRRLAALKLELTEVPVHVAEGLTDDQKRAYRIADNKTAELAEWNDELLKSELKALDIDWESLGFSKKELESLKEDSFNEDFGDQVAPTVWEVIGECDSEAEQKRVFELLQSEGVKCRVLIL